MPPNIFFKKSLEIQKVYLHLKCQTKTNRQKLKAMTSTEIINLEIETVALTAMNDILSAGDELTASKYKIYVDLTCQDKGLEFENASAKFNFETLVMYKTKELMPKFYDIIYPPVYMDSRGNYTTDSSKWA